MNGLTKLQIRRCDRELTIFTRQNGGYRL